MFATQYPRCGNPRSNGIISLLAEVSHDEVISFLPRRERPLLAGNGVIVLLDSFFRVRYRLTYEQWR